MKLSYLLLISLFCYNAEIYSQDTLQVETKSQANSSKFHSPYTTKLWVDGPITVGAIGLNVLGVTLIGNKHDITLQQLNSMSKNDVPWFDRSSAGYYSKKADDDSYIPFKASFAMPVVLALIDKMSGANWDRFWFYTPKPWQ